MIHGFGGGSSWTWSSPRTWIGLLDGDISDGHNGDHVIVDMEDRFDWFDLVCQMISDWLRSSRGYI